MTTTIGIRELVRNSKILEQYDYVNIEDKKTHEYKGLFVSAKYAKEFKEFLDEKLEKIHNEKITRLKKYAGKGTIDNQFDNMSSHEIKAKKSMDKYSE